MMTAMDLAGQPLVRDYDALKARLPGADLPWLSRIRTHGLAAFAASGLPSRKLEAWKYTDLRPLARDDFVHALARSNQQRTDETPIDKSPIDRVPALLRDEDVAARLVFVDGCFRADLSTLRDLPDCVMLEDLATALKRRPGIIEAHLDQRNGLATQPLLALNTAFMDDGFVLSVPRGVAVGRPIEIVSVGGVSDRPIAHHPRILIELDEGAEATVVEHWTAGGDNRYFVNCALDVRLGDDAKLRHYRAQAEGAAAFHIATLRAVLKRAAVYEAFAFSIGGRLSRLEARVRLEGEGAHCGFGGAFLMRGEQHCDNTTVIEHRVPRTSCREMFKGVLDEKARGVFQGRIVVEKGAQKTDGHQSCKTLLLSDTAEIDAKPELEIYADDVKCSHGATAGQLSEDALFYLRSRGIDDATAHRLLIEAFVADALGEISFAPLRGALVDMIAKWMKKDATPVGGADAGREVVG